MCDCVWITIYFSLFNQWYYWLYNRHLHCCATPPVFASFAPKDNNSHSRLCSLLQLYVYTYCKYLNIAVDYRSRRSNSTVTMSDDSRVDVPRRRLRPRLRRTPRPRPRLRPRPRPRRKWRPRRRWGGKGRGSRFLILKIVFLWLWNSMDGDFRISHQTS